MFQHPTYNELEHFKHFRIRVRGRPVFPESAKRKATIKAMSHPGQVAWVIEHGGGQDAITECLLAAAVVEDNVLCQACFVGTLPAQNISKGIIAGYFGFNGLQTEQSRSPNIRSKDTYIKMAEDKKKEESLDLLKTYLILASGEFLDRAPLYINHKNESIRDLAKKVLSEG